MKVSILNYPDIIEFELSKITQLCGQNIRRKHYIINSVAKYFSNGKYSEADEQYKDNVLIDEKLVGRNYFKAIHISGIEDILSSIKIGKTTMLYHYLKSRLGDFNCNKQMSNIEDSLTELFNILNTEIAESIGSIELDFITSDLWDIVQKSTVNSINGEAVELKPPIELLRILVNLIIQNNKDNGERIVIIFENVDHILSICEYKSFLNEIQKYCDEYNIYFILSTSLDGYILANKELLEGVTVINNNDFTFPNMTRMASFINDNYPCYKIFESDELLSYIEKIVQKIGKEGYITESVEMTICKMINDTLIVPETRKSRENKAITAFLNGCSMV